MNRKRNFQFCTKWEKKPFFRSSLVSLSLFDAFANRAENILRIQEMPASIDLHTCDKCWGNTNEKDGSSSIPSVI